ncbi:MAG: hypothetical protein HN719_03025 [Alphaproteobacteria bacterium]|nr:hypothetical protein [Alphaproteobacteria bacterium]
MADEDGDVVVFEKEMALTYADFFRIIPRALGSDNFEKSATGVVLADGTKRLEITLGEERIRQIALMKIPACHVRLEFTAYTEPEREAALDLFDRIFQKGGG